MDTATQVVDIRGDPVPVRIEAGHNRPSCRAANGTRRVGRREAHPLGGKAIKVRRTARGLTIGPHRRKAMLIREHEKDVRSVLRHAWSLRMYMRVSRHYGVLSHELPPRPILTRNAAVLQTGSRGRDDHSRKLVPPPHRAMLLLPTRKESRRAAWHEPETRCIFARIRASSDRLRSCPERGPPSACRPRCETIRRTVMCGR